MLMTKSQYNYGLPTALKLLTQAKRQERAGREELVGVQRRRFGRLLDHAIKNSPFYQKLYEELHDGRGVQIGFDEIERLPAVTKSAMMENMDEVLTDRTINKESVLAFAEDQSNVGRMFRDRYFVARTSGTTGLVGHYVHDLFSWFLCFVLTGARSKARG